MRKMEIQGKIWEFRFGRGNAVIISPIGKKHIIPFTDLTGRTWSDIERGQWKKTTDGMVKPGHVQGY